MSNFHELCAVADLSEDEPLECSGPDGEVLVVVSHGGKIYALAGECPHQAAPLADAEISEGTITCCLHFWSWKLEDGSPVEEADQPLPIYPVTVQDGKVWLTPEK